MFVCIYVQILDRYCDQSLAVSYDLKVYMRERAAQIVLDNWSISESAAESAISVIFERCAGKSSMNSQDISSIVDGVKNHFSHFSVLLHSLQTLVGDNVELTETSATSAGSGPACWRALNKSLTGRAMLEFRSFLTQAVDGYQNIHSGVCAQIDRIRRQIVHSQGTKYYEWFI